MHKQSNHKKKKTSESWEFSLASIRLLYLRWGLNKYVLYFLQDNSTRNNKYSELARKSFWNYTALYSHNIFILMHKTI
jgi:hypothetical protein